MKKLTSIICMIIVVFAFQPLQAQELPEAQKKRKRDLA